VLITADETSQYCNLTLINIVILLVLQVAVIVPYVQTAPGRQEAQRLPARPVARARRPLMALSAQPPVSVLLEGVVPAVPCAQQAATPPVEQRTHAPAALLEPQLSVSAMMILLTVSASQGKWPPHSCAVAVLFLCQTKKTLSTWTCTLTLGAFLSAASSSAAANTDVGMQSKGCGCSLD
jgi:hypothetical protein